MPDFFSGLNSFRRKLEDAQLLPDYAFDGATITGVIDIDADGVVVNVTKLAPKDTLRESLPRLPLRTNRPVAAYLTGTLEYWFGENKTTQLALHEAVLKDSSSLVGKAILTLLRGHHPNTYKIAGTFAVRVNGNFAHHDPDLLKAWLAHYKPVLETNPRIRVSPADAFIRLGTSSSATSTDSYGSNPNALEMLNPGGAGIALNWLLERSTTVRHQNHVFIAWLDAAPLDDPTPAVAPMEKPPQGWQMPNPSGNLHVAVITARPPARMSLRYYWQGDAATALKRISDLDSDLREAFPHIFTDPAPQRWLQTFRDQPRFADMACSILQSTLNGHKLSDGVSMDIVRMLRKPGRVPNELMATALLEVWARQHGHFKPAEDAANA